MTTILPSAWRATNCAAVRPSDQAIRSERGVRTSVRPVAGDAEERSSRIRVRAVANEQDLPVWLERQCLDVAEDRTVTMPPDPKAVSSLPWARSGRAQPCPTGVGVAARNDLSVGLNREPSDERLRRDLGLDRSSGAETRIEVAGGSAGRCEHDQDRQHGGQPDEARTLPRIDLNSLAPDRLARRRG